MNASSTLMSRRLLKLALLFSALSSVFNLSAQDCSPADITLANQSEIDAFQTDHGPCSRVVGNILIGHYGDIVNLNGLSELETVEGDLSIQNNFELIDVAGLGSLTRVGGKLHFYGNDKLPNLNGMSSLTSIGGGLKIEWNDSLVDFTALYALGEAGESQWGSSVEISNNNVLTNVDGLIGLSATSGGVGMNGNDALTHLGGLSNLTRIGGGLHLNSNHFLTDGSGLGGLTEIGGDLRIDNHEKLSTLHLSNLTRVGGFIEVTANDSLESLDLEQLGDVNGWLYINYNNGLQSINLSDLYFLPNCIEIRENPALTTIELSNLSSVWSCVWINGNSSLESLSGFSSLTSVSGSLEFRNNGSIESLAGLENLVSAGGVLIQANLNLSDCTAISRLLDPVDDPPLGPGEALSSIPDVAGSVVISNNAVGCDSWIDVMAGTPVYGINSGLNDAWFNPETDGQGFFITVYPGVQTMFLSWFTYDAERPPDDVNTIIGEPGHRWLTAQGGYAANEAQLDIWIAHGGVFDSPYPVPSLSPDGEMIVEFDTCNSGTITYTIPSAGMHGTVPIERIALDNAGYCAALNPR